MSSELEHKENLIENELPKLMESQQKMKGQKILKCIAEPKAHLDGFMSSIFMVKLTMEDADGKYEQKLQILPTTTKGFETNLEKNFTS